ncbi:MAG: DUF4910 domain-containing protein [Bacteroidales bacterium]|nr:DUF4910 domain-containing protein [Bacteroidales bacterium]
MDKINKQGEQMYALAKELFPICRSLTGNGVRETLNIINSRLDRLELNINEVPTGTKVFDWTVPKEWNIKGGYIETLDGKKIVDFKQTNLHIMGYSTPVDAIISREELLQHIYSMPDQPEWIPYVTSYYKERWGFCMSEKQKLSLHEDKYHVVIDSTLEPGSLTYADLIIKGESDEEILFSTYVCHPSMANNELSGPVVQTQLINHIAAVSHRRYTYRFVFIPETIGSITYLSRNYEYLKKHVIAGFVLSCVGDDRAYSFVHSKYANTLTDKVLINILKYHAGSFADYSFLERGSDERQYNASGIDLPVCSVCRTKYGKYPEYHTSADDMSLISPAGLQGSFDMLVKVCNALEYNRNYKINCKCEPQLGKRGLYPTISMKGSYDVVKIMVDFLAYADGKNDLIDISNIINQPVDQIIDILPKLMSNNLISY